MSRALSAGEGAAQLVDLLARGLDELLAVPLPLVDATNEQTEIMKLLGLM